MKKKAYEAKGKHEEDIAMCNFQFITANIGVSFAENSQCTPVEQICILDKLIGKWKYEAPGFIGLVIQANHALIFSRNNGVILDGGEFLSLNEDELLHYCNQHKLSNSDRERVARWVGWSKSSEAKALEAYFRNLWEEQEQANADFARRSRGELIRLPRAVEELALAKSHRRCCVCHDLGVPFVTVFHILGLGDGGTNTLDNAVCLCDKCYAVSFAELGELIEPKYFALKAKRDRWWQHCLDHPGEPFGLFLDVGFTAVSKSADAHRYRLVARYTNTTKEAQDGWELKVCIPGFVPLIADCYDRSENRLTGTIIGEPSHVQLVSSSSAPILPGQSVDIVPFETRIIEYEINNEVFSDLRVEHKVTWQFTIPNRPAIEGRRPLVYLQEWHQRKMAA